MFVPQRLFSNSQTGINEAVGRLKQKYMGVSPEIADISSSDNQITIDGGGHPLPLTNFLNAQCIIPNNAID